MTNPFCANCCGKGYVIKEVEVPCYNCGGCGHVLDTSGYSFNLTGRVVCPVCNGRGTTVKTIRVSCSC